MSIGQVAGDVLPTIAVGTGVLGVGLLGVLVARLRELEVDRKLRKHRATTAGMADLLIYGAEIEDGIVLGKDGSLMAAWLYRGDDNESSTATQREMASYRLNHALARLGNGWMVHIDAVRRVAPSYPAPSASDFPDPVTRGIDEERRRLFESIGTLYEGYFVLTVTYLPPLQLQQRFVERMYDDDTRLDSKADQTRAIVQAFQREIGVLEANLSTVVRPSRLSSRKVSTEHGPIVFDDLLSWLQYCITGIHQPMRVPSNPMYLDAVLGGQELRGGVIPRVGQRYVQVVAIEGFPSESSPGLLSALAELPMEYRWSTRFIFMDPHEATAHLEKFRKRWRQKVRGFFDQVFNLNSGNINQDALSMVEDASAAIAEVNSGNVTVGYYTSVIVLMHEDRSVLEHQALAVRKTIHGLGFAARIETINTMDAFVGSLPGHAVENVRRPLLNTLNLADLIPTSTLWSGSAIAPCPLYPENAPALMQVVAGGSTKFDFNLHDGDVGHTLISGPTGNGKSVLLALIASQLLRYKNMTVMLFDKGMSAYPLASALNSASNGEVGLHFAIGSDDDKLAFCPLQFLASPSDRAWAVEWIETILNLNNVTVTPMQRNAIATAIFSMYSTQTYTLSDFVNSVQDGEIRLALKPYVSDGVMGHLLDAESDGLALSRFTVFEIESLMMMGERYALPVLLYLFRRIERSLTGQPAALILDEAWLMLGHPVFRAKIREWLKVLRRANCAVIMATQSLSDSTQSGIWDVIVESTAAKIFLPNKYAADPDVAAFYTRMGLNPRQIDLIRTAVPKRHYYLVTGEGRRMFELAMGPLELAVLAASDKESIAAIKTLQSDLGNKWLDAWLEQRGIQLNDYLEVTA